MYLNFQAIKISFFLLKPKISHSKFKSKSNGQFVEYTASLMRYFEDDISAYVCGNTVNYSLCKKDNFSQKLIYTVIWTTISFHSELT